MLKLSWRWAVAVSTIALTVPATAQKPVEATNDDDIIVTAQRANETQIRRGGSVGVLGDKLAEDVPFSVKSYNAALILNQQPLTLGQVLENDPSIRISYGFGNAAEQFVVRGFPLFGDDIGFDGLYGLTPRQLIAPELYDSVQVLNGASAFLNGAAPGGSGIGGSVNLIPKRANDAVLTRMTANFIADGYVGGSFDVGRRFNGGSIGVRINGAHRQGNVAIDDEYRQATVVGGAVDYRGKAIRLSLDLAYQRVEIRRLRPKVTIASGAIPAVPVSDANYGQPWTYSILRDIFGAARFEWDVADNALLYAQIGARDGAEDGVYGGIIVTDAVAGAATGSAIFVPRTDNNEAVQAGARIHLLNSGLTHEINLGAGHIRQVNRNAFDFLSGFSTNLYATPVVPLPGTGFVGGNLSDPFPVGRTRLTSAFASDTLGMLNDRISLTIGMRLQQINTRSYSYADGKLQTEYAEDAVTPVIGLVIKPTKGLSLFANRIEGLRQGPTAPIDPTIVNGGEIFAPFRSVQYEIGGKLSFGAFNASLAAYRITLPSAYAIAEPGGQFRFGIFGEQRNQGIELSVDGELARGLRVIAGASLIEANLYKTPGGKTDGNNAPGVPELLINGNIEWDLPFASGLTLTGRAVHTDEQAVDAANTLRIPAWTRLDLGARYVVAVSDRPLTLRFGIDNVADKRYWASAFEAFGASLLQGSPRTIRLSASIGL